MTEKNASPDLPSPAEDDPAFPARTLGAGLQPLAGTLVNGVREFELTCSTIDWEVAPGQRLKALA